MYHTHGYVCAMPDINLDLMVQIGSCDRRFRWPLSLSF